MIKQCNTLNGLVEDHIQDKKLYTFFPILKTLEHNCVYTITETTVSILHVLYCRFKKYADLKRVKVQTIINNLFLYCK